MSTFADSCKHYVGLIELRTIERKKQCGAGVLYADVTLPGPLLNNVPCFRHTEHIPCHKREWHTAEEIAADEAKWAEVIARTLGARAAIIEHAAGKVGVAGQLPCAACGTGQLSYTIAESNGHVHARCSTEGCVFFME